MKETRAALKEEHACVHAYHFVHHPAAGSTGGRGRPAHLRNLERRTQPQRRTGWERPFRGGNGFGQRRLGRGTIHRLLLFRPDADRALEWLQLADREESQRREK